MLPFSRFAEADGNSAIMGNGNVAATRGRRERKNPRCRQPASPIERLPVFPVKNSHAAAIRPRPDATEFIATKRIKMFRFGKSFLRGNAFPRPLSVFFLHAKKTLLLRCDPNFAVVPAFKRGYELSRKLLLQGFRKCGFPLRGDQRKSKEPKRYSEKNCFFKEV